MRYFTGFLATSISGILAAAPVAAHPTHLIEVAGHNHWLAGIAIGTAIAVGLWQGRKGKSGEEGAAEEAEDATNQEPQEA
ncbi:MAG: hypothetical protein Q9M48_02265 [Rhodobacterales bacterium]|nr:hypothetical protein [Rhodobacterales bacterium]